MTQEQAEHFVAVIEKVTIEPHSNADALEIAKIKGYSSVVKKGNFVTGQLIVYIPEDALIPVELIPGYVEKGYLPPSSLDDKKPFRVRPAKLRGVLSQGIIVPAEDSWKEGDDVKEILGIKKWEPPAIPEQFRGKIMSPGSDLCIKYDIENFKRFPNVFIDGEMCVMTEKIHGTWSQFGVLPPKHPRAATNGRLIVSSKGLASKGISLKTDAEDNQNDNVYVRTALQLKVLEKIDSIFATEMEENLPVYILGEIFGSGVQDLTYGTSRQGDSKTDFRVFDIYIGLPGTGKYLNDEELDEKCKLLSFKRVPILYRGPFSQKVMEEYTDGKESVSGKGVHIREGVVIRPSIERYEYKLGRVQLKSISEKYLLRKNATEYN